VKIKAVRHNNRKRSFEIFLGKRKMEMPYSRLDLRPSPSDALLSVIPDPELGSEAFTYTLASGRQGTVHVDQVLEYNRDPEYLRQMLLYKLTIAAQRALKRTKVSKREIIRRMRTSPTQFYRLLDTTNTSKSIDEMVRLLAALDQTVDLVSGQAA